jgi:hypothetical protein
MTETVDFDTVISGEIRDFTNRNLFSCRIFFILIVQDDSPADLLIQDRHQTV